MQTSLFWGGGFGNPGVHNLLEPATFGVPIIVGPNYSHFETIALVNMGGCISVSNKAELNAALKDLITDANFRHEKVISAALLLMNKGATNIILKNILLLIRQTTIRH
jgi:3-deoxy-D-manno-octulosonic-acid transferase